MRKDLIPFSLVFRPDDELEISADMGTNSDRKTTAWLAFIMNLADHLLHLPEAEWFLACRPLVSKMERSFRRGQIDEPAYLPSSQFHKLLVYEATRLGPEKVVLVNLRCDSVGLEVIGKPSCLCSKNSCVSCVGAGN